MKRHTTRLSGRSFLTAAAVCGAVLTLTGCPSGTQGIFATVAQEQKVTTNNLNDELNVAGVVRAAAATVTDDRYLTVAGTTLYSRGVSGQRWESVSGTPSDRSARGVVGLDTNSDGRSDSVFVWFEVQSEARDEIWQYTAGSASPLGSNAVGTAQSTAGTNDIGLASITGMQATGQYLIVSGTSRTNAEQRVVRSWDTTFANSGGATLGFSGDVPNGDDVRDVAAFGGNLYYVGSKGSLYRTAVGNLASGTSNNLAPFAIDPNDAALSTPGYIRGVATGNSGALLAFVTGTPTTAASGTQFRTYVSTNAATFAASPASSVSFTDAVWVGSIGSNGGFVVGTRGDGLRHLALPTGFTNASTDLALTSDLGADYRGTTLDSSTVDSLMLDSAGLDVDGDSALEQVVFVLTQGNGLWNLSYDTGTGQNPNVRFQE